MLCDAHILPINNMDKPNYRTKTFAARVYTRRFDVHDDMPAIETEKSEARTVKKQQNAHGELKHF